MVYSSIVYHHNGETAEQMVRVQLTDKLTDRDNIAGVVGRMKLVKLSKEEIRAIKA